VQKFFYVIVLLFLVGILSGCASSIDNLQRESARNIDTIIHPKDIQITDIQRGAMNVNWKATVIDGTVYSCSADDMVRRVYCVK